MRVLVTGASGFLGSALCEALLARGDEVVGLTRDPRRAGGTQPAVTWHEWDPTAERPPEDAMTAVEPRPATLVSQSAVGYYGDRGDAVVDESMGPGSSFDAEVCVAWEAAAREAERVGVRVVILRTGLVLDPRHGLLKQLLVPFRLGLGGPLAGGRQFMSWIHREDEVRLLLWALENHATSGTYNATAPNPVTNREFSKTLGSVLGRPAVVPVPKFALKARFGDELGEVAAGGQRVLPRRALDAGFEFAHPDIEPALRDLLGRLMSESTPSRTPMTHLYPDDASDS